MKEKNPASSRILFCNLPDPQSRFVALRASPAYHRYEMCVPHVFTADGNIVVPWEYENMIPDGTLVTVHGKMKMLVYHSFHPSFQY